MDRGTHVLAVILVVLCVFAVSAEAAGEAKKKTKGKFFEASKNEAIIITSDRMELDRKKNTITYQGNVVAVRGDATPTLVELCSHERDGLFAREGVQI